MALADRAGCSLHGLAVTDVAGLPLGA